MVDPVTSVIVVIIILIILGLSIRIVNQYERGVVFRLGKVIGIKEPGLRIIIPLVDRMVKPSLQIITMPIQSQKIITEDNVSIDVAAVAYFKIVDPYKAVVEVENYTRAVNQISQTTVRSVVGQFNLDEILSETPKINQRIKEIIDNHSEPWGISVTTVEIKDITLPENMKRVIGLQAEAEREKRAKIIAADGEYLSAAKLGEAADIISEHPIALQLRIMQVLNQIAVEKNSTIIFPAPLMNSITDISNFLKTENAEAAKPRGTLDPLKNDKVKENESKEVIDLLKTGKTDETTNMKKSDILNPDVSADVKKTEKNE